MADVAIFVPEPAVGMSAVLITELCWVAAVDAGRDPAEAIRVVSLDGRPVTTHTGLSISVNASIGDVSSASLIFLSAFWGSSSDALARHRDVLPWIRQLAADGARIAACSTGSFFLAATGLLDGRVATTYPPYARTFRRRFQTVEFHPERSITDAGGLMCADAIPSSLDLIISTLGDLYGNDISKRLATDYLLGLRRNYTVANLAFDGQKYHGDRQVLAVQRWFERHLDEPIRIGRVAHHFGLSPRTLTRRFTAAVGEPPSRYLQRLRVEHAKEQLAEPGTSVGQAARAVGYTDVTAFSATFRRLVGVPPSKYRPHQ
jgi:transcriptional regulator GlxA family with amidase domain